MARRHAPAVPSAAERRVSKAQPQKVDARCDRRIAALAADSLGVLSVAELRACGLDDAAITVRGRRGALHRLHRGVYAVGHAALTREARFLAAVKACGPGAVLSHFAAAAVWALIEWEEWRYPDVTVAGPATRTHGGVRVHRAIELPARDLTVRAGIPITTPARTLADLAGHMSYLCLRRAIREGLAQHRVNLRQLNEVLNRLGPRRGCRNLRRIVAEQPAPTKSVLEDILLDLILGGGFERPDVNLPLRIDGRWVVPDFRWPAQRLVVEADGARWHDNELARRDDAERQGLLEAHGERVLRVTWRQATAGAPQTLARIAAAGAPLIHRPSN